MKLNKLIILFVLVTLLAGPILSVQASLPAQGQSPDSVDAVPILVCPGTGTGGDRADLRGIRFTVSEGFNAVEARFAGDSAGTFAIQAELRRSNGFLSNPIATDEVVVNLPDSSEGTPYQAVRFNFGNIRVSDRETFTVKFVIVRGVSNLFFEVFGIGNTPCPDVQETDENNVAEPTERGDPAGFKVLAPNPDSLTITSSYAATPPVIDGKISTGEWDIGNKLPFDNGFITVRNDGLRLYVLIDVLYDDHADNGSPADYFWLTFDVNRDGAITPNVDKNYGTTPETHNMRYQYYLGPASWTGLQPDTFSARARGFGCFFADGTLSIESFFPISIDCDSHRLWELAIDLDEIDANAGNTLKMGLRVHSETPGFTNDTPQNFTTNFSNLISVVTAPVLFLVPDPDYTINFDSDPIEVTQAIQTRDNTLPLVQNKTTAARVYVDVNNAFSSQPVTAFLYGSSGGVDLPGSPMMKFYYAPTSINRAVLNNTANFALPSTWDEGTVSFSAKARSFHDQVVSASPFNLSFNPRKVPTYWYIPINTGSNASPNLISTAEMNSQRSYTEAAYPVHDINWVYKPWTVIGPTTVGNTIAELNQYYNTTFWAWLITVIFTGNAPFTMPEQIYGFTPSGGGLSDPTWIGANGRVARGFRGTSREATAAHEINHNLDRSNNGTWGRHVPLDCGAAGPDPNWPYPNDDIQEVGFDTRQPWVDTSAQDTVIPGTFPDFMSYCQSGKLPTKWISPYRWNNLYGTFTPSAATSIMSALENHTDVYYVSGMINQDGSGALNPAYIQPGIPSVPAKEANAEIQLLGSGDELLGSLPFNVDFLEDPEEPFATTYFNLQLPVPETPIAKIVLLYNEGVLDEINVSPNPPVVEVNQPTVDSQTIPAEGITAVGEVITISWSASDEDGDALTFSILYSNDEGDNWYPVATNLTGNSYEVDTSTLPGGEGGIFKVIVTDGANTIEAENPEPIVLPDNPPFATVTGQRVVPVDTPISLMGEAHDLEDGELGEDMFAWAEGSDNLGTGKDLNVVLPFGSHDITLFVSDSDGNTTEVDYPVFVGELIFLPTINR